MITGSIASTELILMILRDTHAYLFFRCFFHCIFECVFQSLIALTKKDEESTLLIFGTTKLNWHDLVLNSWCSSTILKLSFKYAGHVGVL